MQSLLKVLVAAALVAFWSGGAHAQFRSLVGAGTIVIKSGESFDLANVYYVSQCRSVLKSPPEVEMLDGPSAISVTIREAEVLPRAQGCTKKVPGGVLVISAKDIDDPSFTRLTLRFNYRTKDGDRKYGHVYNIQLVP